MPAKSVAVITMSVRSTRAGPSVASLVKDILEKPLAAADIAVTPVDVKDFKLPVYDEAIAPAMVPAYGSFKHEHSKAWSAEIAKYDGYVLVIPEYNYGVAGGTKNAVDYLLNEWKGKPMSIISYGAQGGSKASEQLKEILGGMGLRITETRPQLAFANPMADGGLAITEGKISPESTAKWTGQSAEIVKAAEELKELLLQPNDEANAPKP
ncbi:flavoprotein [Xylariaceae sp. FL1651]|nr:flavoprotein [Xylariaceae sp. FL1651]